MKNNANIWDREKYLQAWNFASIRHSGQKYGGHEAGQQIDYLTHIGMVSMEIIWALGQSNGLFDPDLTIQCAILHDTLEDTKTTFGELQTLFGKKVAEGVRALTKNKKLPNKNEQMTDSLQRIKQQPKEIWAVKLADRISNLYQPPYFWNATKICSYLEEAKLIYDYLHDGNNVLANRLEEKIVSYERFITL